ncbi:MAG: helix-turn-helix domain-containing protein, partial [Sciscionella sp.]
MDESSVDIGHRLRRIRHARDKSLAVIAGLAGISTGHLSRIERGKRALDRHSLIIALADALEIAPSELTKLPVPAPGNGKMDAAVDAVRHALMAVSFDDQLGGQAHPVEALRARVTAMVGALCRAEHDREVGAALPGLIVDLHASIADGKDVAELFGLAVLLHTRATVGWLSLAGSPLDLRSLPLLLGQRVAGDLGTTVPLGLAAAAGARVMLAGGACDIAQARLDAVTVPTSTPDTMQLAGFLALLRSVVAASDNRPGDVEAPLEFATELAARTGEGNAYGLGFGPFIVRLYQMSGLLEAGDYRRAAGLAEGINPDAHVNRSRQAAYWADYGRALARLPRRRDDAVVALRHAERISPRLIQRGPVIRGVLAELLGKTKQDMT